ncbi:MULTISPECIES: hypothetical protein [Ramlibacter]|uniref:Uncharacterized protein n=1 Tax=Ramlibacter pinisoli TaxID=2682844 RepID=A0A6N8IY53_9BURK|nr:MULTISPECIES: hypothetical protein [Ramlibacter]MBA2960930.1 hypothetical protein [Ramlibacter sp. CGMCC 1.13660]MVQ30876.1 hypothetical protein [Ramlibacter pinisoli]
MPSNVRVIKPSDFLRADPDGQVDLPAALQLLQRLAAAAAALDEYEVLIDIRHTIGRLRTDELQQMAAALAGFEDTFQRKTAVLCPPDRFENGHLFSLLAAQQGFGRVRAFLDYETAMEWLLGT